MLLASYDKTCMFLSIMKRTRTITLTLLAGAAGLSLSACKPDDKEVLADSPAACAEQLGDEARAACEEGFAWARAEHERTAPRFASRDECLASGAQCMETLASPGGIGSVFMPVMAGVLIGHAMNNGVRGMVPVYGGASPVGGCASSQKGDGTCTTSSTSGGGGTPWYHGGSYVGSSGVSSSSHGARPVSLSEGGAAALSSRAYSAPSSISPGGAAMAGVASAHGGGAASASVGMGHAGGFGASAAGHGGGGS